jgi:hypothetical protein
VISTDLAAFIESGVTIHVATRSARLVPDHVRGAGVRVEAGRGELTVFLPEATAATSVANVEDNGRIAVAFSRPIDHRSFQVKGRVLSVSAADPDDRAVVDRYRAALVDTYATVGVPPAVSWRIASWPCRAIRFRVESVYVQTPGPGAGAPLGGGEAR